MNREEVFQVLGIEETADERMIKNAYREKLTVTNPEDNPEGFKRLRAAYEEAMRLTKMPEEEAEEDLTPSGLWVRKAADIYKHISQRIDPECWKRLFNEDVFQSLEEEENCTHKLLVFLMDHFKLPTDIWRLLDKEMMLRERAPKLRERFPADFIAYVMNRIEQMEDFDFDLFEGADDASYDLFLQHYENCWRACDEGNFVQAKEFYKNAIDLGITHPAIEVCHSRILINEGKKEEAIDNLKKELEKFPENITLLYNTAELLWKMGKEYHEQASVYFYKLKEMNDKHYMSNVRLTEYLYERGEYRDAKKCAEKVLSAGSDDDFIELLRKINVELELNLEKEWFREKKWESGLDLAWCYLQDGKLTEGVKIARQLETLITADKEAEWKGLISKYALERADYDTAIEYAAKWEEALHRRIAGEEEGDEKNRDIDRVRQSHMIRIQAYHHLGYKDESYFAKAIAEAESILEGKPIDIQILMEMTQVYNEMGEYEKCDEIVERLINDYQVYAAYASRLEACRRQLDAGGVVRSGSMCIRYFPDFIKSYEYIAKVYLDLERPEEMKQLLEAAKENNIQSDLLDAYVYLQDHEMRSSEELNDLVKKFREEYRRPVENGDDESYAKGCVVIDDLLRTNPESFMFVERAIFRRSGHHYQEAEDDINKALQINPANPYALNCLSFILKYEGKFDEALVAIKKAILYMDEGMSPVIYTDLADLCSLLGDYEAALEACLKYKELSGDKSRWFLNQLAETYLNLGRDKEACDLYLHFAEKDPYGTYNNCVEATMKCSNKLATMGRLAEWAEKAKVKEPAKGGALGELMRKAMNSSSPEEDKESIRYYIQALWAELIFGKKENVSKLVYTLNSLAQEPEKSDAKLADSIYACILIGDEAQGRKLAKKLQAFLRDLNERNDKSYFNRGKGLLEHYVLADWYDLNDEHIKTLIDKEETTEICHFCTSCVCREMEGLRIAYLLRIGKREEAKARLENNLRRQPSDEFMLAIKHIVFEDNIDSF
ncbi:MAG: hypothetical protein MJ114_03760 [Acetatifactor sp.]|nr:hypothetical protein [Acetatifactor sp.]